MTPIVQKKPEGRVLAEWLSPSKVAKLLGVHPSTVRNWSDQGVLPVHRTSGGHRRYLRSEVDLWMQTQGADTCSDGNLMVQAALRSTRFQISEGRLREEAWYKKLDDEAREQYRRSGRSLVEGLIGFITSDGRGAETETEALGYEYAARAWRYGLNSVEAVHAFLFFRNVLIESLMNVFESAAVSSPQAWSNMLRRVNKFTDGILVSLLEKHEGLQKMNR